jgi:hypothetical protein
VWFKSWWGLNQFGGVGSCRLHDIVNGLADISIEIKTFKAPGVSKKVKTTFIVNLKILFEEIWDYALEFTDWTASNLRLPKGRNLPQLQIYLSSERTISGFRSVKSRIGKGSSAYWPRVEAGDGGIVYRGTWSQLQAENLGIRII